MKFRQNRKILGILLALSLLLSNFIVGNSNVVEASSMEITHNEQINAGENLLTNGSFETVDDEGWASSWSTWVASGNLKYAVDESVSKAGSRSLKISADELSRGTINQGINLTERQRGKYYRVEQWMKT